MLQRIGVYSVMMGCIQASELSWNKIRLTDGLVFAFKGWPTHYCLNIENHYKRSYTPINHLSPLESHSDLKHPLDIWCIACSVMRNSFLGLLFSHCIVGSMLCFLFQYDVIVFILNVDFSQSATSIQNALDAGCWLAEIIPTYSKNEFWVKRTMLAVTRECSLFVSLQNNYVSNI